MAYTYTPPANSDAWRTGYCGCFEDCGVCLCAWCCPCVVVGRLVEILDHGATSCGSAGLIYFCIQFWSGCGCFYTCGYRAKLRSKYGLPDEPCGDFFSDCCCPVCSLSQQYRELMRRDINPHLGYVANRHKLEVQAQPVPVYQQHPPVNQFMQK